MAKQIKIGFDKTTSPIVKQFPVLLDIVGNILTDAAGNPLITEEEGTLASFALADNSLSISLNNEGEDQAIPIEEQFPVVSEVSNTLLGVPRAEEQLSLFSDVSTYGFDINHWNYYTFSGISGTPSVWYNRENPFYGRRSNRPAFIEGSNEQALYFRSFPPQYGFVDGPIPGSGDSPTETAVNYFKFIALGKWLYELFKDDAPTYAKKNFLDENIQIIDSGAGIIPIYAKGVDENGDPLNSFQTAFANPAFNGQDQFYRIQYRGNIQDCFDQIERWTLYFDAIADKRNFPQIVGIDYTNQYRDFVIAYARQCVPGSLSLIDRISVLESQRAFRYQPGRISGFTFGIRMRTTEESTANFIEWGAANDTDQYMFQLRGPNLNIVRRSTVPLLRNRETGAPYPKLIQRLGFRDADDERLVYAAGLDNSEPLYETVFTRDIWNGDQLTGPTGDPTKAGYNLTFEEVTMYKIEFSWYGAIGAKFYAYVPVGTGEARWVLMHTLVIENGLDQPILNNPDLKFKYLMYSNTDVNTREPTFVYKYGSSYYIDGGDEGTVQLTSFSNEGKDFLTDSSVIGIMPKPEIINTEGTALPNNKRSYPTQVNVTSTKDTKISIKEVTGSPDGTHFYYAPNLHNTRPMSEVENMTLRLSNDGSELTTVSGGRDFTNTPILPDGTEDLNPITLQGSVDNYAKLMDTNIPGIYLGYKFGEVDSGRAFTAADVLRHRRAGDGLARYSLVPRSVALNVAGEETTPRGREFDFKLFKLDDIIASKTPIISNKFLIHFLNPVINGKNRRGRNVLDFTIGVTDRKPDDSLGYLQFSESPRFAFGDPLDVTEYPEWNWSYDSIDYTLDGEEFSEDDAPIGVSGDIDYRLETINDPVNDPARNYGGRVGAIEGEITTAIYALDDTNPVTVQSGGAWDGYYKILFAPGVVPPDVDADPNSPAATLSQDGESLGVTTALANSAEIGFRGQSLDNPTYWASTLGYNTVEINTDDGLIETRQYFGYVDPSTPPYQQGSLINFITRVELLILTLSDSWRINSFRTGEVADNPTPRFTSKKWTRSQIIRFNARPLYIYVRMHPGARLNNITVQEITPKGEVSGFTPEWVADSRGHIQVESVLNETAPLAPSSFNSSGQLSGLRFDRENQLPLRAGETIYNFYVGENETKSIDLSNIFGPDREVITRGLKNNRAYYFTATSLDGLPGVIDMTLTIKEQ